MFLLFALLFVYIFVVILVFNHINDCSHKYITTDEREGIFIKMKIQKCSKCGKSKETISESHHPFNIYNNESTTGI